MHLVNLSALGSILDKLIQKYDNMLLIGDFNSEVSEDAMHNFLINYSLKCLIKEPTCYKDITKPSTIDLFLTNKYRSFMHTMTFETGLSDHHKMILTVLKSTFIKSKTKKVFYRSFKNFENTAFRSHLGDMISDFNNTDGCFDEFHDGFQHILNLHAPLNLKTIRGNKHHSCSLKP